MTNGRSKFLALAFLALSSLTLLSSTGCAGALMMPYYLIYGTDSPAIHQDVMKGIRKESKVVVICRSNLNLFGSANPAPDLATGVTYVVSNNLKDKKKKKLEWIPFTKVEDLFDEEEFKNTSFEKMGAAVGADYVVGIEIDSFETRHSSQFYQGSSKVLVRFIDVENQETLFRESMPQFTYPPTPVPVSDYQEEEFQKLYIVKLSKQIATLMCPYDAHDQYAQDSDFPNR